MNITLLGATGFAGGQVLKELLAQNHWVKALVRNPVALTVVHPRLIVMQGDALNKDDVCQATQGQDAVVQCLGVGGKGSARATTFISRATAILLEAMEQNQVPRLICLSNVGAGNSIAFYPWIFRKIFLPYFMKWLKVIIDDKNRMEPLVMQSNLQWTIVRSPNIVDKPAKGTVNATLDGKSLKLSITNQDLAQFIVRQLNENTYLNQAPSVSN